LKLFEVELPQKLKGNFKSLLIQLPFEEFNSLIASCWDIRQKLHPPAISVIIHSNIRTYRSERARTKCRIL